MAATVSEGVGVLKASSSKLVQPTDGALQIGNSISDDPNYGSAAGIKVSNDRNAAGMANTNTDRETKAKNNATDIAVEMLLLYVPTWSLLLH